MPFFCRESLFSSFSSALLGTQLLFLPPSISFNNISLALLAEIPRSSAFGLSVLPSSSAPLLSLRSNSLVYYLGRVRLGYLLLKLWLFDFVRPAKSYKLLECRFGPLGLSGVAPLENLPSNIGSDYLHLRTKDCGEPPSLVVNDF